jgi:dipeptidyl aminopeptidase/acylaminoacyl peptidase
MPAMMRYDRDLFSASRYFKQWRKQFPTDAELSAVSPINYPDRLKVPILIGHGEDDDNVPVKQSHKMVDALIRSGANVTSVFYKDAKHSFGSTADLKDWLDRLDAFLAKYNPS